MVPAGMRTNRFLMEAVLIFLSINVVEKGTFPSHRTEDVEEERCVFLHSDWASE